jgi:hypothetical protein
MSSALDVTLKDRLRAALEREPATEAELRKLIDEGRASALLVRARLESVEGKLASLAGDPESSLSELATTLREVQELRPALDELQGMLGELHARAPELRRSWLAARPASGPVVQ